MSKTLFFLLVLGWLAMAPTSLSAGGASEKSRSVADPGASSEYEFFEGRLDLRGNAPHLTAVIILDDGQIFLVDPEQWASLPWGAGYYRFKAILSAARPASPALAIPAHSQVVHVIEALALKR